ncbi:MAG: lysophospholipid acyltransferase family protein [Campylobacteraceae bacterium]|jgi:putative hemolysin|nr:lysophospholipid acyltransferase family protein [Campylobacteraceae bacterium]
MFNTNDIVREQALKSKLPLLLERFFGWVLRRLLHERQFTEFEAKYPSLRGVDCVEEILRYFEFRCEVDVADLENIPTQGAVIIVANHPIGSLDALALIKVVSSVRGDVKIMANRILSHLKALENIFIAVDNMGAQTNRTQIKKLQEHLRQGGALIVFPAGEVSRLTPKGIRDCKWNSGFVRLALRMRAAIVPVHIKAKNSLFFYLLSIIHKPLSTYLLIDEMFKQRRKGLKIRIGKRIPYEYWNNAKLSLTQIAKSFRRHIYQIGKGKRGCIRGETPIALPSERLMLKSALEKCEVLGKTPDEKSIYLYHCADKEAFSPILHELGRLREISFRAVGEGSGRRLDLDCYDDHYYHLILWDSHRLEIVGAYRFMPSEEGQSMKNLYSRTLFNYHQEMETIVECGVEMGRSFIQPIYWRQRGLDYLWQGMGAYLARNPQYRYLFGPVSISASMPPAAIDLLVSFYRLYFAPKVAVATSKNPYPPSPPRVLENFIGNDYKKDIQSLKSMLNNMNCSIPTLYKQYSELCEQGGVQFIDFGIDPDFNDCIDGFVLVDTTKFKPSRYNRYIAPYLGG